MARLPDQPITGATAPSIVYVTEKTVWEYKQITRDLSKDNVPSEEDLNDLGKDGWELASAFDHAGLLHLYFKRVKA